MIQNIFLNKDLVEILMYLRILSIRANDFKHSHKEDINLYRNEKDLERLKKEVEKYKKKKKVNNLSKEDLINLQINTSSELSYAINQLITDVDAVFKRLHQFLSNPYIKQQINIEYDDNKAALILTSNRMQFDLSEDRIEEIANYVEKLYVSQHEENKSPNIEIIKTSKWLIKCDKLSKSLSEDEIKLWEFLKDYNLTSISRDLFDKFNVKVRDFVNKNTKIDIEQFYCVDSNDESNKVFHYLGLENISIQVIFIQDLKKEFINE